MVGVVSTFFPCSLQNFLMLGKGFILHLGPATCKFDDGARTSRYRATFQHHESDAAGVDSERVSYHFRSWSTPFGSAIRNLWPYLGKRSLYAHTSERHSLFGADFAHMQSNVSRLQHWLWLCTDDRGTDRSPYTVYVLLVILYATHSDTATSIAGFVGSAPVAIGGGTVSDLFSDRDRANAMAVYSLGPLLGPALGPIAGGYIAQTVGYKYIFVVIGGLSAISGAVGIPLLRETYAPVIRLRIAKKSGDPEKAAEAHPHLVASHGSGFQLIWVNLSRPFILLTRSLVCFVLSLYMAL